MKSHDYYCSILRVDPAATHEQIKRAYRNLVKIWHPDRFAHDSSLQAEAEAKFKEINEAYKQLQSFRVDYRTSEANPARPFTTIASRSRGHRGRLNVHKSHRSRRRSFKLALGIFVAVVVLSKLVSSIDPEIHESTLPSNPAVHFNPLVNSPEDALNKPSAERELARIQDAVIKNMKESYDGGLRLLALHEAERKRIFDDYLRSRELYHQGLITRAEVTQAEQTVAAANAKIDADKRWLTQAEVAIAQASATNKLLNLTK